MTPAGDVSGGLFDSSAADSAESLGISALSPAARAILDGGVGAALGEAGGVSGPIGRARGILEDSSRSGSPSGLSAGLDLQALYEHAEPGSDLALELLKLMHTGEPVPASPSPNSSPNPSPSPDPNPNPSPNPSPNPNPNPNPNPSQVPRSLSGLAESLDVAPELPG